MCNGRKCAGKVGCAIVEFKQDEATRALCPIRGNVSDGTYLVLAEETAATGE